MSRTRPHIQCVAEEEFLPPGEAYIRAGTVDRVSAARR